MLRPDTSINTVVVRVQRLREPPKPFMRPSLTLRSNLAREDADKTHPHDLSPRTAIQMLVSLGQPDRLHTTLSHKHVIGLVLEVK